jgi:hypothetical protein
MSSQFSEGNQDPEEFYLDEAIERASIGDEPPCLRCLVGELGFERFQEVKSQRPRRDDGFERLLRDVLG